MNTKPLPFTLMLSPDKVAQEYGFSIIRLREWRVRGGGPRWHKIGRSCFYRVADLEAFIAAAAVDAR